MNDIELRLCITLDHSLDDIGTVELLEQLREHLNQLYDESGPQQAYFANIKLSVDTMEVY